MMDILRNLEQQHESVIATINPAGARRAIDRSVKNEVGCAGPQGESRLASEAAG